MSARPSRNPAETRQRLLDAARQHMLERGFSATGVDEICRLAGVTKGAFFHHFASKEELGREALAAWAAFGEAIYAQAYAEPARYPLDHVHRFFEIMIGLTERKDQTLTCLVGMLSQELALANSALRECCEGHLTEWARIAARMLAEAKAAQKPRVNFDPEAVAWFLNAVWQGSMLIGKTRQTPEMIAANLRQARAYVDGLFSGELQLALSPKRSAAKPNKRRTK
jgi:TetR/AcrR family transcriptional repressor of nem operon